MADHQQSQKAKGGDYLVTAVGAGYVDTDGVPGGFALRGNIIQLDGKEAERLTALGVVREATGDEKTRAEAVFASGVAVHDPGPAENPYGGTAVTTPEEHAAAEIARASKKGK